MENDDPNITPNAYSAGQLLLDLINGPIFNIRWLTIDKPRELSYSPNPIFESLSVYGHRNPRDKLIAREGIGPIENVLLKIRI